jgi:hypothetical protein
MIQQSVLLSPKFGAKSSHSLMHSSLDVTVVCGIEYFFCQDKFFVNNPLDMKDNDEHTLEFVLHLSRLFRSRLVWTFRIRLILSSRTLVESCPPRALFPSFPPNLMLFLCRIHHEIVPSQINDYK